jgi:adenosine kinase
MSLVELLRTALVVLRWVSLTLYQTSCASCWLARFFAVLSQYVLPPNSTAYIGCVGKDGLADQLRAANDKEGLYTPYQVVEGSQTGACAVVITGHHRSLVTELGAAEKFDKSHFETEEVKKIIDGAKFFYLEGYFLTHGLESALILAKHSHENGKVRRVAYYW